MHHIQFPLGVRPRPSWGAYTALPQTPIAGDEDRGWWPLLPTPALGSSGLDPGCAVLKISLESTGQDCMLARQH